MTVEIDFVDARTPGASTLETGRSAVSWGAIAAGAVVAVAVSLVLLAIGTGAGFAAVSPWPGAGASLTTVTAMTAIWLVVVQWIASGTGGYVAGRLRTKWAGTHTHEVFFRDTAHGFVTWALATLVAVALLSSSGVMTAKTAAGAAASEAGAASPSGLAYAYDVDSLYRSTRPEDPSTAQARAETATILGAAGVTGAVSPADRTYLVQLIVARTGIADAEAQARVDAVIGREQAMQVKARQAADAARKAGLALSILTALAMLVGAFIAAVSAALGGLRRDIHP